MLEKLPVLTIIESTILAMFTHVKGISRSWCTIINITTRSLYGQFSCDVQRNVSTQMTVHMMCRRTKELCVFSSVASIPLDSRTFCHRWNKCTFVWKLGNQNQTHLKQATHNQTWNRRIYEYNDNFPHTAIIVWLSIFYMEAVHILLVIPYMKEANLYMYRFL